LKKGKVQDNTNEGQKRGRGKGMKDMAPARGRPPSKTD